MLISESSVFSPGEEGVYSNVAMRGRHADAYSMYKRGTRDYINAYDKEQGSVRSLNGVSKEIGNPSWKRSFLYILVASLASFLYE